MRRKVRAVAQPHQDYAPIFAGEPIERFADVLNSGLDGRQAVAASGAVANAGQIKSQDAIAHFRQAAGQRHKMRLWSQRGSAPLLSATITVNLDRPPRPALQCPQGPRADQ